MGLLDGGTVTGVMMTGAGEPLGAGDALGTGGGVTAAGEGEGGWRHQDLRPLGCDRRPDVRLQRRRGRRRRLGRRRGHLRDLHGLRTGRDLGRRGRRTALLQQRHRARRVVGLGLRPRRHRHGAYGKRERDGDRAQPPRGPAHRSSRQTSQPPTAAVMTFGSQAATYGSSAPFLPNAPATATIA